MTTRRQGSSLLVTDRNTLTAGLVFTFDNREANSE
jgi:hypothetical protein